jgi:hypothetical protein
MGCGTGAIMPAGGANQGPQPCTGAGLKAAPCIATGGWPWKGPAATTSARGGGGAARACCSVAAAALPSPRLSFRTMGGHGASMGGSSSRKESAGCRHVSIAWRKNEAGIICVM